MLWRRFNGDPIVLPIKTAVESTIQRETDAGYKLKVCIGTDSQIKGRRNRICYRNCFLREGHGGFMFIHNEKTRLVLQH
ncbi:MAG: ribonuclease H-like YkuK family protein [Chitinophagaceae bacterium]